MSQIIYIDGRYSYHADAKTSVEDRGYQFADSIYEGIGYIDGIAMDACGHYARLEESLEKLAIPMPMSIEALKLIVARIVKENHIRTGFVYIQISRGVAPREHSAFDLDCAPIVTVSAKHQSIASMRAIYRKGIRIALMPDLRWQRCDIKTTGLLANCMAKTAANSQGYDDAWLVDQENFVTEGVASNAWIVDSTGTLRTRSLSSNILSGVTRDHLLNILDGIPFKESAFQADEAFTAQEAFISSASLGVRSVVSINETPIGDGGCGKIARHLQARFLAAHGKHLPKLLGLDLNV